MLNFKPVDLTARDLDEMWFLLLKNLWEHGRYYTIDEGSFQKDERLTFDKVSGTIMNPYQPNLAPVVPEGIAPPTTQTAIEDYFAEYLMNSELATNEDYRYSTWIRGGKYKVGLEVKFWEKLGTTKVVGAFEVRTPDQLQWIINHFKTKGFGNAHCFLTVGYPESNLGYDLPYRNENERKTSPCLRGLDFKVIKSESGEYFVCLYVIYRSWDLWGGWPTNMGGFTLLNSYVAYELGIKPGPISFFCKDLHCYEWQLEMLKSRLRIAS